VLRRPSPVTDPWWAPHASRRPPVRAAQLQGCARSSWDMSISCWTMAPCSRHTPRTPPPHPPLATSAALYDAVCIPYNAPATFPPPPRTVLRTSPRDDGLDPRRDRHAPMARGTALTHGTPP